MISFPFPPIGNSFVACSMPKVLHAPAECVKLVIFFDLVMLARITSSGLHARTDTHTDTEVSHTHTDTRTHTQTHTHRHTHTHTHTHRHTQTYTLLAAGELLRNRLQVPTLFGLCFSPEYLTYIAARFQGSTGPFIHEILISGNGLVRVGVSWWTHIFVLVSFYI